MKHLHRMLFFVLSLSFLLAPLALLPTPVQAYTSPSLSYDAALPRWAAFPPSILPVGGEVTSPSLWGALRRDVPRPKVPRRSRARSRAGGRLVLPYACSPAIPSEGGDAWVVRAYYDDHEQLEALTAWRSPWEVHPNEQYVVLDVSPDEYQRLLDAGFRLEIDTRLTARLNQPNVRLPGQTTGIPGYPCYRTVEETFATAEDIVAAHPDLATWIDIGDSWAKTENPASGYDLWVLRLSNAAVPGPKPKLFVMSSVHAREYTPAELATRFAEYLVAQYGEDPDVTWILDYHEIHLLLQANPDGRKRAESGLSWRKNVNNNYCSDTNSRGVDINRNFEFYWHGCGNESCSSGNECSEVYRGPSAASEPETQAVQDYLRANFPDLRENALDAAAPITATGVFLDIHSYSELVMWSWGFTSEVSPNGPALQALGRKMAYFNGYSPVQAVELYPTDGTTDDFAYGELGLAAYTFELGTSFFQDCATFESTILPGNLPSLLYAARVARAPYRIPAGPDALSVTLSKAGVVAGEPVTIAATLDDTRYNNQEGVAPTQTVVAAEYYIDVPPWVTATTSISYPLAASDGAFDASVEAVAATLDTTGLSMGRHMVFVRGRDADGNWGPFSAGFLYSLDPATAPIIEGFVRKAESRSPLLATVSAGPFQTQTDLATGYYSMTLISGTYDLSAVAAGYAISTVEGLTLSDNQTLQQDFALYPFCDVFSDDVESGNLGWTVGGDWSIITGDAHSPDHAWTDSPGGNYDNNVDASLISPVFDLSDYESVVLSFWHHYALEQGYDYGRVEYSLDGGSTWTAAASYSGEAQATWTQETLSLPLAGQPNARVRFRVRSDTLITRDGWYIDDVLLSGAGAACIVPTSPVAAFSHTVPVLAGFPVTFMNLSSGSPPFSYTWSFGDGVGTSTDCDPVYTYTAAGAVTVTLVATNSWGSDRISRSVSVLSPTYALSLTPVTATQRAPVGSSVDYTLTLTNLGNAPDRYRLAIQDNAWETTFGDPQTITLFTSTHVLPALGGARIHIRVTLGVPENGEVLDAATIVATSQGDGGVSARSRLTTSLCVPAQIMTLTSDAPVVLGEPVHISASVTGDPPITYTWDFGGAGTRGGTVAHPTFMYDAPGVYTVTLHAANACGESDGDTATLAVRVNTSATYALTVDIVGSGSVDLDPPGGVYTDGTLVELSASAEQGWRFDAWSGALTGSDNPESLVMDSHKAVTATFAWEGAMVYLPLVVRQQ